MDKKTFVDTLRACTLMVEAGNVIREASTEVLSEFVDALEHVQSFIKLTMRDIAILNFAKGELNSRNKGCKSAVTMIKERIRNVALHDFNDLYAWMTDRAIKFMDDLDLETGENAMNVKGKRGNKLGTR